MINADSLEVEVSSIGNIEGEVSASNSIEGELNNTSTIADITLQEKSVTPSTSQQEVTFDDSYDGLSKVVVKPVTSSIDPDIKASNIKKGVNILNVTGTLEEYVEPKLQEKSVSPSTSSQSVTPDSNYDGLSKVTVNAMKLQTKTATPKTSSQNITPDSSYNGLSKVTVNAVTSSIDSNIKAENIKKGVSILNVTGTLEESVAEDLSTELTTQSTLLTNQGTTIDDIKIALQGKTAGGGEEIVLQEKTITPSTSQQNVIADTGYNGLSKVVVSPVTSAIDSDIKASNIKKGVNILGVTGTLEESVAEDLTSEFNEYESALSTQETTIDDIMTALEGKTAGGGSTEDLVYLAIIPNSTDPLLAMTNNNFASTESNYTILIMYDDNTTEEQSFVLTYDENQGAYFVTIEGTYSVLTISIINDMQIEENYILSGVLVAPQIAMGHTPTAYIVKKH